jgi:hypothetical protein
MWYALLVAFLGQAVVMATACFRMSMEKEMQRAQQHLSSRAADHAPMQQQQQQ